MLAERRDLPDHDSLALVRGGAADLGSLPSPAGPATPFTVDDLEIAMLEPDRGRSRLRDRRLHAGRELGARGRERRAQSGTTGTPVPFRFETTNPGAITGSLQSNGSILLSGTMAIAPGVTISF